MDRPTSTAEMPRALAEVSLQSYQTALLRLNFLKAIAGSLFLVGLFVLVGTIGVALSAGTALRTYLSYLLPALGSSDRVGVGAAALAAAVFAGAMFGWFWALARMWRPASVIFPALLGVLVGVLEFRLLVVASTPPINALKMALFFAAIVSFAFVFAVLADALRLTRTDVDDELLITAKPGRAGFVTVWAEIFAIPAICAWLPRRHHNLLARTFFSLSAIARGLTVWFVLQFLVVLIDPAQIPNTSFADVDAMIADDPVGFAIFVLIVLGLDVVALFIQIGIIGIIGTGVVALLRHFARRFSRVTAENLVAEDPRPAVLFLRSFQDDQIRLSWGKRGRFRQWLAVGEAAPTLDHAVLDEATPFGPVLAIGVPGKPPPFGIARTYVTDAEWQDAVARFARDARAIVIALDETAGVKWEMAHIRTYAPKTLFLLPPRLSSSEASSVFLHRYVFDRDASGHPPTDRLAKPCIGWYQPAPGKVILLTSENVNAAGYIGALRYFGAYQQRNYVPDGIAPAFAAAAAQAKRPWRDVDQLMQTRRGIVVLFKDGRVMGLIDREYRVFPSARHYRDSIKDADAWQAIDNDAEKESFRLSHDAMFEP
jgi:hypothetical protein